MRPFLRRFPVLGGLQLFALSGAALVGVATASSTIGPSAIRMFNGEKP
jgi:hypothetical protein